MTLYYEGIGKSVSARSAVKRSLPSSTDSHGQIVSAEFGRLTAVKCTVLQAMSAPVCLTQRVQGGEALVGVTLIPKSPSLFPR